MTHNFYKILRRSEWESLNASGEFAGSADDQRDGFIHLSTAAQLAGTLAKHYTRGEDLVLAEVDGSAPDILADLKFEVSRGGDKFPHLYGVLSLTDVVNHWTISAGPDGLYTLPL